MRLHEAAAPLALMGVLGAGAVVMGATCVASAAASAPGSVIPGFGSPMLRALIAASGTGLDPLIGADGDRFVFWLVLGVIGLPLLGGGTALAWWVAARAARVGTPAASLASRRDLAEMHGKGAAKRARNLRPSLGTGPIAERDLGVRLGATEQGDYLVASEEDVALIVAGPRSNKTSALVVPAILTAPGPVITTSNKVDVYTLTSAVRRDAGRVFALDPEGMLGLEQDWWFNPLTGIRDTGDASRLMEHFIATVGGGSDRADPYFTPAAERLLNQLTLAAVQIDGSLRDVRRWLATRDDRPVQILIDAGEADAALGLKGLMEAPEDQKGGVYETALTALRCLESETIARYCTPPPTWKVPPPEGTKIDELDPWRFLVGYRNDPATGLPDPHDTLYAITEAAAKDAAPVVAALIEELLETASSAASTQGGRLNPPVRAVLDEAANICPLKRLPSYYSYYGSKSIPVMTFLQSEAQGVRLWGVEGMKELRDGATVWMVGAGSHDTEFCERVSQLLGEHDVPTWSDQRGRGGGSTTRSYRRERIMAPSDISSLPKTHAVLISSGRRGGVIRLLPWYTEPDADDISANAAIATEEIRRSAIAALGAANPLAQALARTATPAVRVGDGR
jgi:type IV secretory pathway TraG/TraD family ATPase VirD4